MAALLVCSALGLTQGALAQTVTQVGDGAAPTVDVQQADAERIGGVETPRVLVVGDSLSSEYGIQRGTGWVALLKDRLAQSHEHATVINASISGDTTSGGLARLPALLQAYTPTLVIIELGGNDALRGSQLAQTRSNLQAMVKSVLDAGAVAVVVGMQIPPNYGPKYAQDFEALFAEVAEQTGASLVPFLLDGVESDRSYFIEDGIHPSEPAQPRLFENVWSVVGELVPTPEERPQ